MRRLLAVFCCVLLCAVTFSFLVSISPVYATIYFSDGFESGNFSAWTGTFGTGTREAIAGAAHSGSYGAHHSVTSGNIFVTTLTLSGYSTLFTRAYVKFLSFPASGYYNFVLLHYGSGQGQTDIGVKNDSGTAKFVFTYYNGSQNTVLLASPLPALNTWYCLTIKTVVSATVGESRGWINGVEKFTETNLNNNAVGNVGVLNIGIASNSAAGDTCSGAMDDYIDDVVLSDSYLAPVGPSVAGFAAPSSIYAASAYAFINCTVNKGDNNFANVTVTLSGSVALFWDNTTSVFSVSSDPNNYCTLNASASVVTAPNSTEYQAAWNVKFAWNYTAGTINVSATVYDAINFSSSNSQTGLFTYYSALSVQDGLYNAPISPVITASFTVIGVVYFNGTKVAPNSGTVLIYASRDGIVEGSTSTIASDGTFQMSVVAPGAIGLYSWIVYTGQNSVQNQTENVYVNAGSTSSNTGPVTSPTFRYYGSTSNLGRVARGKQVTVQTAVFWTEGTAGDPIRIDSVRIVNGPNWTFSVSLPRTYYTDSNGNGTAPITIILDIPSTALNGSEQLTFALECETKGVPFTVNCLAQLDVTAGTSSLNLPSLPPLDSQTRFFIFIGLVVGAMAIVLTARRRKPV